jgi:hypothetical protein
MFQIRCWFRWRIHHSRFSSVNIIDEFIYVIIVFVIDNKLLKTTFKFWTCFVCQITIDKTLFRFFAFFFDMIRWSTCKFIICKVYFRYTNWKFITRTRIRRKSIIVMIVVVKESSTILSICKTLIVKQVIDALKIRMICWFIYCFSIKDINAERVNKKRRVHWWIMQFDDECRMIFTCSNEIFEKIIRIVIFEINILL